MIYHHVTHWSKSRPVCHVMSAPIAGRVGLVSCSHICLKWLLRVRESDCRTMLHLSCVS